MKKGLVVLVALLLIGSVSAIYTGYVNPYAAAQRGPEPYVGPFKPKVEFPGAVNAMRSCSRTSCVEGSTKAYLNCCDGFVCRAGKCIPTARPVYPMKEYPAYPRMAGCTQAQGGCYTSRNCCVGLMCISGRCRPVASLMQGEAKYYKSKPTTPALEQPAVPSGYRPYPPTYSVPGK